MQCADESLLQMLLDGTLEDVEQELLQAHLQRCTSCRQKIAEYKLLLWDLEHPVLPELPGELDKMQERLMAAWGEQQNEQRQVQSRSRTLIPSWAGYSVQWTRHVPPVNRVGGLLSKAGTKLLSRNLLRLKPERRKRR